MKGQAWIRRTDCRTSSSRFGKRFQRERRTQAGVGFDAGFHVIVLEGQHTAVGVMNENDFPGAKQALRNDEGAQYVIGDHAAGVANHVGVALFEAKHAARFQPRVHAGDDGSLLAGRRRGLPFLKPARRSRRYWPETYRWLTYRLPILLPLPSTGKRWRGGRNQASVEPGKGAILVGPTGRCKDRKEGIAMGRAW